MRFKGYQYRKAPQFVTLPHQTPCNCPWPDHGGGAYITFGRSVPITEPHPESVKGAIKTDWTWRDYMGEDGVIVQKAPVWAVPVPLTGHSLTNLAYTKSGHMLLWKDGTVYMAMTPKERERRLALHHKRLDRRFVQALQNAPEHFHMEGEAQSHTVRDEVVDLTGSPS